jgi:hypothetical protein
MPDLWAGALTSILFMAFLLFPHPAKLTTNLFYNDSEQWACPRHVHQEHDDCFAETTTWRPAVKMEQGEWGQLLQQPKHHWRTMRQLESPALSPITIVPLQ